MSNQNYLFDDDLYQYLLSSSVRESESLQALREETANMPRGHIIISPEQGQLLAFLVKLINAKRALDIGVFTGYSALTVSQALPDDGELIACDVDAEITKVAQRHWEKAGQAHKIALCIAPAIDTLKSLLMENQVASFDFALIDADKMSYPDYFECCLQLVRPGGIIAIDNTFLYGKVAENLEEGSRAYVMNQLNRKIADDDRVTSVMLPMGDGLLLCSPT